LLLPIMLIVGGYLYYESGAYMSTDDAYVEADKVGLSTDVSGLVKAVEVKDNQHVKAGQPLFRLDPCPSGTNWSRPKPSLASSATI
jgi:membrane fusion protein (multidrug efflux system)